MALQYPISFVQSEVPLWVNFKSFSYTSEGNARAQRVGLDPLGTDKLDVWMALPKRINVSNDIKFMEGETPESSLGLHTLRDLAGGAIEGGLNALGSIFGLGNIATNIAQKVGRVDMDLTESIFSGSNLRGFNYAFEMTPKTIKEAEEIDKICSEFQRLAYPAAAKERSSKMYHPPLWGIGIYSSVGGSRMRQWDMSPQNAVLANVVLDKTGAGGPFGFGNRENPHPTTTILQLQFQELEVNVRHPFTGELVARSVAKVGHSKGS
tara:strand:- start:668 stop:1462 length:795 start_codon:yes stop_codon:yes gene_type:complete